ncbi:hypothetical protein [Ruminiclostridium josui]|nr:hypothetical protein [Ruminiclostridium josui]
MLTLIVRCNNPPIIYSGYTDICSRMWFLVAGLTGSGIDRPKLTIITFEG